MLQPDSPIRKWLRPGRQIFTFGELCRRLRNSQTILLRRWPPAASAANGPGTFAMEARYGHAEQLKDRNGRGFVSGASVRDRTLTAELLIAILCQGKPVHSGGKTETHCETARQRTW